MTTVKNDYSLLRPFDLEAAKAGEPICWARDGLTPTYYIVTPAGKVVASFGGDSRDEVIRSNEYFRMAPLAWVEGKPVYRGDGPLYVKEDSKRIIASHMFQGFINEVGGVMAFAPECLTWNQPKVKREGYTLVQKASVHKYKEDAESFLSLLGEPERWAICHVEWEEEAK